MILRDRKAKKKGWKSTDLWKCLGGKEKGLKNFGNKTFSRNNETEETGMKILTPKQILQR